MLGVRIFVAVKCEIERIDEFSDHVVDYKPSKFIYSS